jgi:hypothetical protein
MPKSSTKKSFVTRSRRPEVQAEIDLTLTQPQTQWLDAATGLKTETLARLAREFRDRGENVLLGKLMVDIHKRALPIALRNCRGLSPANTQDVIDKVLHLVNLEFLWQKSDAIPYLEISFGSYVKRKTLNASRDARKRCSTIVSLDDETVDSMPPLDPQEFERKRREYARRLDVRRALDKVLPRMKPEIRVAFEYWYHHDVPIETKKPGAISIEKLVARNKRTVYNWLNTVFAALRAELGESS